MPDICVKIFTAFGFPQQIFLQAPSTKFHGNASRGKAADMGGQTDGYIEASRRFRDYAKAPIHAEILGSKYLQTDGSLDLIFPC